MLQAPLAGVAVLRSVPACFRSSNTLLLECRASHNPGLEQLKAVPFALSTLVAETDSPVARIRLVLWIRDGLQALMPADAADACSAGNRLPSDEMLTVLIGAMFDNRVVGFAGIRRALGAGFEV